MSHWSEEKEKKGSIWHMRLLFSFYKLLGRRFFRAILHPVVFFFFLFSPRTRSYSREFLKRVKKQNPSMPYNGGRSIYWHFYCFAYLLIEKLAAWTGDLDSAQLVRKTDDEAELSSQLREKRGAVVLCSHLGNTEMLRAIGSLESGSRLPDFQTISIVNFAGTAQFNAFLKEVNPKAMMKLINAENMGPDDIIYMKERIECGDLVVVACDRTPGGNRKQISIKNFLGEDAPFPRGAFLLSVLLEAPVYHMFAVREDDFNLDSPYELYLYKSEMKMQYTRKTRDILVSKLMDEFTGHLEKLCLNHPYQWFNFFDFWKKADLE